MRFPTKLKTTFNKPKFRRENIESTLLPRQVRKKNCKSMKGPQTTANNLPATKFYIIFREIS